jgi:WD40 repeat protein
MRDGTIVVWDLILETERCYLDKHQEQVNVVAFLEDWKLISGSRDGGVHIYNVAKGKLEMKRTHLFQEKRPYSITQLSVSESGIAYVIDSLGSLRMYDLWHGEKIARLTVNGPIESKVKGYMIHPRVVMDAQRGKEQGENTFLAYKK